MIRYPKPEIVEKISSSDSFLIEASAGTGKTYTIEHLVVDNIISRNIDLDKMLILTFTEKAAHELKVRIKNILIKIIRQKNERDQNGYFWKIDEACLNRIQQAVDHFNRANISTIHAHFYKLIKENHFIFDKSYDFQLIENKSNLREIFDRWLYCSDVLNFDISEMISAWVISGRHIDQLFSLVAVQIDYGINPHGKVDVQKLSSFLNELIKIDLDLLRKVYTHNNNIQKRSQPKVDKNIDLLLNAIGQYKLTKNIYLFLLAFLDIDLNCLINPSTLKSKDSKYLFHEKLPIEISHFIQIIGEMKLSSSGHIDSLLNQISSHFFTYYKKYKEVSNFVQYNDLIDIALSQVFSSKDSNKLIDILRNKYDACLLDEFQDTDFNQWRYFKKIFLDSNQHSLILVGDPKQAIYSFRGANVQAYITAKDDLAAVNKKIHHLDVNYRSSSELVNALNLLMSQQCESPIFKKDSEIKYDRNVLFGSQIKSVEPPIAPLTILSIDEDYQDKNMTAMQIREVLSRKIIFKIKELLTRRVLVGFAGTVDKKEIKPSDIFILVRNHFEALEFCQLLEKNGIHSLYRQKESIFKSSEAKTLLILFMYLKNRYSQSHKIKLLTSEIFNISIEDVLHEINSDHISDVINKIDFYYQKEDPVSLFNFLFSSTKISKDNCDLVDVSKFSIYFQLSSLFCDEMFNGKLSFDEQIERYKNLVLGKYDQVAFDNVDERSVESHVNVMTIHASKGLEAEVVFIHGGYSKGSGTRKYYIFNDKNELKIKYKPTGNEIKKIHDDDDSEEARLMYVALTRARCLLFLPYVHQTIRNRGYKDSFIKTLYHRLDELRGENNELICWESIKLTDETNNVSLNDPIDKEYRKQTKFFGDLITKKNPLRFRKTVVNSYSRLTQGNTNLSTASITERESLLGADFKGKEFGIVIHDIINDVNFNHVLISANFADFCEQNISSDAHKRYNVSRDDFVICLDFVYKCLKKKIISDQLNLKNGFCELKKILKEVEFIYEDDQSIKQAENLRYRNLMKGYLDLIFEYDSKIYILDWKTDTLENYSHSTIKEHTSEKYSLQGLIYTNALLKKCNINNEDDYCRFGGMLFVYLRGLKEGTGEGIFKYKISWNDLLLSKID